MAIAAELSYRHTHTHTQTYYSYSGHRVNEWNGANWRVVVVVFFKIEKRKQIASNRNT